MNTRTPPLNALKVFEAAARLKSFKKAAEELHVTPAAVSHQLSQLEAMLGVMLFKRVNQGIELTPSARLCLPKLQEGLDCVRESIEQIRQHATSETITVAASPSFAMRWLMPRLHRFIVAHPEFDVQVSTKIGPFRGGRGERSNALGIHACAEEADMVLMYGSGHYPDLRVEKLMSLAVTPMCSPQLLTGDKALKTPEDLRNHLLLHDDRGMLYSNKSFWQLWLERAGVQGVNAEQGPRFTHAWLALAATLEHGGVVASTPLLAAEEIATGRLITPFDIEVPLESGYHMVSTEQAYKRDDVSTFRAWLIDEANASIASMAPVPDGKPAALYAVG